ncbi:MAG: sec-independent protein translocase protein TatA [Candidatus Nitrosomirales archaeon]
MITDFSLNIGGSEWVVIILLGLFLLFGAKRLPQVSKSLGRVIGEYNRAKNTIQDEITNATKPFTTQSKFDTTTPRLPTRQETRSVGETKTETKTEATTDTTVKAETSTTPSTTTDTTITSPVVSEREKLEVIARTLDIEPRGKSTDELKQLIASKMNQ